MMVNENQKLSRNPEQRKERRLNMDHTTKFLLNKIKQSKKKKDIDKIKKIENHLFKIKNADKPDNLSKALKN